VPNTFKEGHVPAAVAISHAEDFLHWDVVILPDVLQPKEEIWGESTVIVHGRQVLNISRYGRLPIALAATSDDFGRTWMKLRPSNLPMVTSKPYAGTLSNGQNYLIGTTTANSGKRRSPLTIAVTRPGEALFCKIYRIRDAIMPESGCDTHKDAALAYPYAVEHDGHLYVGYSNNGGRPGQNINSAELAIIPIEQLGDGLPQP
jgi:BNR repeat-like domain